MDFISVTSCSNSKWLALLSTFTDDRMIAQKGEVNCAKSLR